MNRVFLPAWSLLLGAGWLLGHHWHRIIEWLADVLEAPDEEELAVVLDLPRSNVRQLPRPRFFDQDAPDGGDAA